MANIKLVNIWELFKKEFYIPHYQRGYRWTQRQVEDLLGDILDFQRKQKKEEGEFYCLQPLIVKEKNENVYEVIDGQQRLTTIYLILLYFKKIGLLKAAFGTEEWYDLKYETRTDTLQFLNSLLEENEDNNSLRYECIDYCYISKAWKIINQWMNETNNLNKVDYLNTLLKSDIRGAKDIANNVRFILYEIDRDDTTLGEEIFTRINIGKIPLTNAELIKALFFISEKEEDRKKHQFKRAYEWEYMENRLQDDKFWYFLNKEENATPTRIEFIFDIVADENKDKVEIKINKSIDKYYTFYIFNELIKRKTNINNDSIKNTEVSEYEVCERLWDEVKDYFRLFDEWYNHYEYYHLVGYLVHIGYDIKNLTELYKNSSKQDFKKKLIEKIKNSIFSKDDNLEEVIKELTYEEEKTQIQRILLLFNVLLTMKTGYVGFPYDLYVKEKWSIEHIHAQNSEEIRKDKDRKKILKDELEWLAENKQNDLINEILKIFGVDELKNLYKILSDETELQDDKYTKAMKLIFKEFSDEIDIHSIHNLALLSLKDNSMLGNYSFPKKREIIIELDSKGYFIPIGTKNVFLKYFSKQSENNIMWNKEDRENYMDALINELRSFFNEGVL